MKKLYGKKIFIDGKFQTACVYYADGIVKRVVKGSEAFDLNKQDFDAGDNYVVPGFIDIHTHGAVNVDFADGTPEEIIQAVKYHLSNGSTSILPTVTSSTKDKIIYALSNIEKAMKDPIYGKRILGAHLEGPYPE